LRDIWHTITTKGKQWTKNKMSPIERRNYLLAQQEEGAGRRF